jgi:phage terminase small subunit
MSKPQVTADKMEVGNKGGGRHWTRAEIEARQAAADSMKSDGKVNLKCPSWLSAEARKVWNRVKRQTAGWEMLEEADADMLAIYCDAVIKYQETGSPTWARLVAQYADRLGLTPAARAKLAQKKAEEALDEFGAEFDE